MKSLVRAIVQHVPRLPAILMSVQFGMAAQTWRQGSDTIPGGAKEGFAHGSQDQTASRTQSTT